MSSGTGHGFDIIIAGGGPAGLAFARALDGSGLRIALVERQPLETLADPAPDGREIALTHRSASILTSMGVWSRFNDDDVAPLREARVLNGPSPFALSFASGQAADRLGNLVPNHRIRQALFQSVQGQEGLTLLAGTGITTVRTGTEAATVTLEDGRTLSARLLVAADSRFSKIRDQLGIAAQIKRLGKSMLVCRVAHEGEHGGVATEWFGYGQTMAMLPLNGRLSSAVLTLPAAEIERLAALDPAALGEDLTRRYDRRLGTMTVVGRAHVYPLAITYAHHFAARRAALIGDTAVGMHPVTAHGFNLGLQSAATLAGLVKSAAARRNDIAGSLLLRRYEAAHRLASGPLYAATRLIVELYTDDRPPARLARTLTLRAGAALPFVRGSVTRMLMQH